MRLIDAEAFVIKLEEVIADKKYDEFYTNTLSVGEILRSVIVDLRGEGIKGFELAPTVEERPQGEWTVSGYIDTCRGYVAKCPFCKEDTVGGGNFCKHCGADMRGKKDE